MFPCHIHLSNGSSAPFAAKYLDRLFFWNALDLERKLQAYGFYYNSSRSVGTPQTRSQENLVLPVQY